MFRQLFIVISFAYFVYSAPQGGDKYEAVNGLSDILCIYKNYIEVKEGHQIFKIVSFWIAV